MRLSQPCKQADALNCVRRRPAPRRRLAAEPAALRKLTICQALVAGGSETRPYCACLGTRWEGGWCEKAIDSIYLRPSIFPGRGWLKFAADPD